MTHLKIFASFCLLVVGFAVGCTDDKEEDPFITPKEEALSFNVASEEKVVAIATNTPNYTATISDDAQSWLTATKQTNALKVTATANETINTRKGTITLKAGEITKVITVTQEGKTAELTVTPETIAVEVAGKSISVEVNANSEFKLLDIPVDWITAGDVEEASSLKKKYTFTVAANETTEARVAALTFKITDSDVQKKVTVTQEGNTPEITVTPETIAVEVAGKSIVVEVNANSEYQLLDISVDWIAQGGVEETSSLKKKYTFTIKANETISERVAELTFKITGTDVQKKVTVTQEGKTPEITVTPETITVEAAGKSVSVEVTANSEYQLLAVPAWVTQGNVETVSSLKKKYTFTIAANTATEKRVAELTFKITGTDVQKKVVITQEAAAAPVVEPTPEEPTKADLQKIQLTEADLSSPYVHTYDFGYGDGDLQGLKALVDGNPEVYFHSDYAWKPNEEHYFLVTLKNPITHFYFKYQNRNNGGVNDRPTEVKIQVSNDNSTWSDVVTISEGLPTAQAAKYESALLKASESFKYFKFIVTKKSPKNQVGFFNMAEFELYGK